MLPFGVTIPANVPQTSEIPEGLMNYSVLYGIALVKIRASAVRDGPSNGRA